MKVFDGDQTNEEMVDKLARLALLYQPGTHWEYSMSTDVLGRVIEVVSGQPLDKAIAERVTGPLKMADTGFVVSPDKKDRGARPQKEGTANVGPPIPEITLGSTWKSGGAGLVSTAGDYGRFLQMLANGGELDGMRVISRETVGRMTTDQLPPNIEMGEEMWRLGPFEPSARVGQGYGLGVAVRTDAGRNPLPGSIGEYFWPGAWGTYFWADPREHLFVVFMLQSQTARERYRTVLQELVYQALVN
jgi:CubicO group peptidase (beta-lactamase class C family)